MLYEVRRVNSVDNGLYSRHCPKAHRDYSAAAKAELVEILYFKHFYEHYTDGTTDWPKRGKRLEKSPVRL